MSTSVAPTLDSVTSADFDPASLRSVRDGISSAIHGKDDVIELAIVALVSGGHLLLEDIPGVGKSTLARALAQAVGGQFRRIQFTSDLLPADVLGLNVWRPQSERFEFRPGPIFANFVLADEINRAPPRTQSALLEAMGEHQVSIDGHSHPLPDPFMVVATQNPVEHYGTYPLPESQRDRFVMRLSMGFAAADIEASLLAGAGSPPASTVAPTVDPATIVVAQRRARSLFVHRDIARYAQKVVQATREHPAIRLGVSTRGALSWMGAARAKALLQGRSQVSIDDLQDLAVPALAHRLLPSHGDDESASVAAEELIRDILATTEVPR